MKAKVAQQILKTAECYSGSIDGIFGRNSRIAARKYSKFPDDWNTKKLVTGVIQVACIRQNIEVGVVDGLWGKNTQNGYVQLCKVLGVDDGVIDVDQNIDVVYKGNVWPKSDYNSMVNFYGKVGTNQTSATLPYTMVLAWDESVKVDEFTCHEKCKDSFENIFEATLNHYGLDAIKELGLDQFGGCLNVRKMRGGSSWSKHSWGCAIDIDPDRNQLRWGRDRAFLARLEYEPFWKIVEAEGGYSLGRKKNYDWMHIEMTK